MNITAILIIISSFFAAITATAQEVDEEGVAVMKAAYYSEFANLPPSRNCEPADVKGLWWEAAVLENPAAENAKARAEKGIKYLRFGGYNQYDDMRSKVDLAHDALPLTAEGKVKQYIVSVRGLLYFYQESKLFQTHLCFIATENTKEYSSGDMLLMKLVEEKTPKSLSIFRPVSALDKKEKKNVR